MGKLLDERLRDASFRCDRHIPGDHAAPLAHVLSISNDERIRETRPAAAPVSPR